MHVLLSMVGRSAGWACPSKAGLGTGTSAPVQQRTAEQEGLVYIRATPENNMVHLRYVTQVTSDFC